MADVRPLRPEYATASLRHLWGIMLPAAVPRDDGPVRRHYTGAGRRRRTAADALARATRVIPDARLVTLTAPPGGPTTPDVFLAALHMLQQDAHAVVAVLPVEHLVDHGHRLMQYVARASAAAVLRPDLPMLVAAYPGSRDPEYAWVDVGDAVDGLEAFGVRAVRRLVPRPSVHERSSGGLLGTVAIVTSARTLVAAGRRHLPDVLECLEPLEQVAGRPEESLLRMAVWESMPHASLCADVLAHVPELGVIAMPDALTGEWIRPELQALAS